MTDGAEHKSAVDASPPGFTIRIDPSACLGEIRPLAIADALKCLIKRIETERTVDFRSLRLIVVTGQFGEEVSRWQRALGMPVSGVSNPPGGTVAGKHVSWGNDLDSARSVVILPDYVVAAAATGVPSAAATIIHELGHVHDDFVRGLVLGFPPSQPPLRLADWRGLCACIAENTWGEYAAESLAANYMARDDLYQFALNDRIHLEGLNERIQQSIGSFRLKQRDFRSLWAAAVTDVSDIFANLGRAAAHIPFAGTDETLPHFADSKSALENWKPVVERVTHELRNLGGENYKDWKSDPFSGLRKVVAAGFEAAGFLPIYDGQTLRVNLR